MKDIDEYQQEALRTAGGISEQREVLLLSCLGLAGEAGEFIDHVKKHVYHNHKLERDYLERELGDILWYVALAASALNLPLSEVLNTNVLKLRERYPTGFDPERSINRG